MYKLFAFDIDGTLVNDAKEVTPRTQEALQQLHDLGHHVVISSGRPFPGVASIAERVGKEAVSYLSCFNGGLVKDLHTEETLVQSELTREEVFELVDIAKENGVDVHFYDDKNVLTPFEPLFDYIHYEERLSGMAAKIINMDNIDIHTTKLMFTAPEEVLAKLEATLDDSYYERFSIVKSEPYFLEFNPLGIDKGASLAVLAEKLGIKQEEVMTFGDQNNDLSMIEWAGKGVAMGNAIDSLKEASDYVTTSNEEDGIVDALNAFVFDDEHKIK